MPDAESFAEEFIDAATRAGPVEQEAEDEVIPEEVGGPFVFLDDEGGLPPESYVEATEPEEETEIEEEAEEKEREEDRGASWAARGV